MHDGPPPAAVPRRARAAKSLSPRVHIRLRLVKTPFVLRSICQSAKDQTHPSAAAVEMECAWWDEGNRDVYLSATATNEAGLTTGYRAFVHPPAACCPPPHESSEAWAAVYEQVGWARPVNLDAVLEQLECTRWVTRARPGAVAEAFLAERRRVISTILLHLPELLHLLQREPPARATAASAIAAGRRGVVGPALGMVIVHLVPPGHARGLRFFSTPSACCDAAGPALSDPGDCAVGPCAGCEAGGRADDGAARASDQAGCGAVLCIPVQQHAALPCRRHAKRRSGPTFALSTALPRSAP